MVSIYFHAYQFASRRFGNHLPATATVGAINLLWLLPIAMGVMQFGLNSSLGLVLAYAPLVVLAIMFRAGELERPMKT